MRFVIPLALVTVVALAMWRVLGGGPSTGMPPAFAEGLTLDTASVRAAESGRPVLVFATADWCGPCQQLKRGPLSDERVTRAIKRIAEPVYLDLTNPAGDASARAHELGVPSIPTLIILRGGQEVSRLSGYHSAIALTNWLESIEAGSELRP
jgi:thiol:disulfide interchange protein